MSALPASLTQALTRLRGTGPTQWKRVARLLDAYLNGSSPAKLSPMHAYEAAARCMGLQPSTVRNWVNMYHAVGGALIERYAGTFGYAHWRAMVPAARRAYRRLPEFAAELAATVADATHAGLHLPCLALIEQAAATTHPPQVRFAKRLTAAKAALALLLRDAEAISPVLREDVLVIASALNELDVDP